MAERSVFMVDLPAQTQISAGGVETTGHPTGALRKECHRNAADEPNGGPTQRTIEQTASLTADDAVADGTAAEGTAAVSLPVVLARRIIDVLVSGPGLVILPLLLTLAVATHRMTSVTLWRDELATWWAATIPFEDFVRLMQRVDAVHATYYLIMRGWIEIFGDSPTMLRMPSVLAMAGVAVLVAVLGRKLYDPVTGLFAGLLFAVQPAVSRYGQEARGYAFMVLAVTLSVLLLARALEKPTWWRFLGYAVTVVFVGATNLLALVMLVGHAAAVATAFRTHGRRVLRWLPAVSVAVLALIPLVMCSYRQRDQIAWLPRTDVDRVLAAPAAVFLSGEIALLLIGLAVTAFRFDRRSALMFGWVAAGPVTLVLISRYVTTLYEPRYVLWVIPGLVILAAAAVRGMTRKQLRLVAVHAVAIAVLLGLIAQGPHHHVRDSVTRQNFSYDALVKPIIDGYRPGDGIAYVEYEWTFMMKPGIAYSLPDHVRPKEVFVTRTAEDAGWWGPTECATVERCETDAPRIWLVRLGTDDDPLVAVSDLPEAVLRAQYTITQVWRPQNQLVVLLTRNYRG
ncbi:hypothetical protein Val02_02630 [Virgisporangium aliadipatigenens]|uniref:Glycosyltransferase RgtA/B/C/D-like domain-containing protein n=1 Tax=Virgisporangium aliadipatigenens TaxID=741659 RepID=A0A8J4DNC0_9ACTN|nr:glycosyltransferase family 39 protein [Virgisporangium aliadipatigenens]GIJ43377.1 hypothetical protein Val02_02630 [Virgisporangium aliadipatigenens]